MRGRCRWSTKYSRIAAAEKEARLARAKLDADVAAFKEEMAAPHPELVATLKTLGHQPLVAELAKNVSPLAVLGGESVTAVVERVLGALPLGTGDADVKKVVQMTGKSAEIPPGASAGRR